MKKGVEKLKKSQKIEKKIVQKLKKTVEKFERKCGKVETRRKKVSKVEENAKQLKKLEKNERILIKDGKKGGKWLQNVVKNHEKVEKIANKSRS